MYAAIEGWLDIGLLQGGRCVINFTENRAAATPEKRDLSFFKNHFDDRFSGFLHDSEALVEGPAVEHWFERIPPDPDRSARIVCTGDTWEALMDVGLKESVFPMKAVV
jgi:hypothetical protein